MEFELLSILSNRDTFYRFKPHIKPENVSKYTGEVMKGLDQYYTSRADVADVDWSSFRTYFTVILNPSMPKKDAEVYSRLFDRLQTEPVASINTDDLVNTLIRREYCSRVVEEVLNAQGDTDLAALADILNEGIDALSSTVEEDNSDDLDTIVTTYFGGDSTSWGMKELDKAVGPLRPGDFIMLGARPETGKTSFFIDVLRNMVASDGLPDGTRPVLFLNNEEDNRKIVLRSHTVALNKSTVDLVKDTAKSKAEYSTVFKDRFKVLDVTGNGPAEIEALIRKHSPRYIVFNVLDKVGGFYKAGNETERLRALAKWARDLGKKYDCIVFAVGQADASAEHQQWVEQSQLYGSKTGIPGEADLLIMMGSSGDDTLAKFRYFNIVKNKLPGDAGTDPKLKHHKFSMVFDHVTGRFTDV